MDQPKIPTLKDSKKPQVKVRGLGGVTLFERLKQFKKKDLAFILAGLCTLLMAPLAEHFMMSPESGDASLQPGWGGHGGSGSGGGIFDGHSPYEGSSNMAPGSAIGGGSDVITPLNARDPSALIMGPGSAQQPPTSSAAPSVQPPASPTPRSDQDLKDALAASASHAATAAVKKAPLPLPKIALSGSNLRGLGVAAGGSSASASLGPISSQGLAPNKAASSSSLQGVKGGSGIQAVSRGQSQGGNPNSLEALKKAGDAAGNIFNRAGSAANNAAQAAAQGIPTTGGSSFNGNGQGGTSANDKAESGNNSNGSKSTGESLAYQMMKENMEKQLALYWKEKESGDMTLEFNKIMNTSMESAASSLVSGIMSPIGTRLGNWLAGSGAAGYSCSMNAQGQPANPALQFPAGQCQAAQAQGGSATSYTLNGTNLYCGTTPMGQGCSVYGSPASPTSNTPPGPTPAVHSIGDPAMDAAVSANRGDLDSIASGCNTAVTSRQQILGKDGKSDDPRAQGDGGAAWKRVAQMNYDNMTSLSVANAELSGTPGGGTKNSSDCNPVPAGGYVGDHRNLMVKAINNAMQLLVTARSVDKTQSNGQDDVTQAKNKLAEARREFLAANLSINDAESRARGVQHPSDSDLATIRSWNNDQATSIDQSAQRGGTAVLSVVDSARQAQDRLGAQLTQAEQVVNNEPHSADSRLNANSPGPIARPNSPTVQYQSPEQPITENTAPTMANVQGMNDMLKNLNDAIDKVNNPPAAPGATATPVPANQRLNKPTGLDQPTQPGNNNPPAAPAGGGGTDTMALANGVNTSVGTAETKILTACRSIGFDCTKPVQSQTRGNVTDTLATQQGKIDPLSAAGSGGSPIVTARTNQLNALNTIKTAVATFGAPATTGTPAPTGTPTPDPTAQPAAK